MALFEHDHFGKVVSKELSDYIRIWTSKEDYAEVSEETNLHVSTLKQVVYRTSNLTSNNQRGIVAMMRRAVKNCNNQIESASKARLYFSDFLKFEKK